MLLILAERRRVSPAHGASAHFMHATAEHDREHLLSDTERLSGDAEADEAVSVLLVDDQPENLLALEALLADSGLQLTKAKSGLEALSCLLKKDFALILLDVRMPGMDGYETAAMIRSRDRSRYTPIIFLTAFDQTDGHLFRGYAAGAVDYLTKPIVPDILRSKVSVFAELYRKTEQIRRHEELRREQERREHEQQLSRERERWEAERLRTEIRLARQVQQKFFPAAPLPLPGFDVGGASYPAEATGGDYFDYIPMSDGCLGIVIADVSGHGFGPALLMAEVRAFLRAFLVNRSDVGEIISLVNEALVRDQLDDRFATLMFARFDPHDRTMVYANAGHPSCYVVKESGEIKQQLTSTGLPLGIFPNISYPANGPIALEAGDLVLLLTDGILEAHAGDGVLYGMARTVELLRANWQRSAREMVDLLYASVRTFCSERTPMDDMTAVIVKVTS
jgi:serine phosphatase RsbU (regulator of sigma subunit)